ncbi:MAG: hypothetical protein H0W62_00530 [Chitinophagales bacterium]|nr:hypothetical protein [Chitinophagales bacterium]
MKKNISVPIKSKNPSEKIINKKNTAFNFLPEKIDLMRQAIVTVIWRRDEISGAKLETETKKEIHELFSSDFQNYFDKVKQDLESKGLIELAPDKKPPHFRLKQKLEE